jgi:putative flippase GtrA
MSTTVAPTNRLPSALWWQLVRYGLVGVTNTAVTLAAYAAVIGVGLPVPVAAVAGWAAGAVNGYRLNRGWTFRSPLTGARPASRYVVVALLGAGLNAIGATFAVGHEHLPRLAGEVAILPAVTLVTFVLCRRWVFAGTVRA